MDIPNHPIDFGQGIAKGTSTGRIVKFAGCVLIIWFLFLLFIPAGSGMDMTKGEIQKEGLVGMCLYEVIGKVIVLVCQSGQIERLFNNLCSIVLLIDQGKVIPCIIMIVVATTRALIIT